MIIEEGNRGVFMEAALFLYEGEDADGSAVGLMVPWDGMMHDFMVWKVVRVFFLDSFSPKSSSFSPTLVTLAQINNYEN